MSEMKNTYILDRINSWLDIAKEKIGELEYVAIETSHNDTHRAQIYFFLMKSILKLWETTEIYINRWVGKQIMIYAGPTIKFGNLNHALTLAALDKQLCRVS